MQDIAIEQQKELGRRLGSLVGKPKESVLHVHPITEGASELGDEISVIDSKKIQSYAGARDAKFASSGWHSG